MTDDELRLLVRDAIARHLGGSAQPAAPAAAAPVPLWRAHPSFGKYIVPRGTEQDGPCLIEPTVHCNHCGFCQSHGH
jgi:hypothetical protein